MTPSGPPRDSAVSAFYVLEGSYTFYTDAGPAEGIGPGTFVFIPTGRRARLPNRPER